jgi:hypothetical protein
MEKKLRGRPRKKGGSIEFWQFTRAAIVMCAYDEARENGQKHSVAIRHAVYFVKQLNWEMPISEAEVKRTLAAWRPRGSRTILHFERSIPSEEDVKINRWIREQLAALQGKKGLILLAPPNYDLAGSVAVFTIRLAERPNYPRHNLKNRQEMTRPINY